MRSLYMSLLIGSTLVASCSTSWGAENDQSEHEQLESALKAGLLELWFPRCLDRENGGFLCDFDSRWNASGKQPKSIVIQGRMTWLASRGMERYPQDPRYRQAAEQGFQFLRDIQWDNASGGWFWHLDRKGRQTSEWKGVKHAYGISFGIYGTAAYYAATKNPAGLDLAKRGYQWLEQHAHDAKSGGYFEYFAEDGSPILTDPANPLPNHPKTDAIGTRIGYKSMNTHIHLLEAISELYTVWPDAQLKVRLAEMLGIVRDRIVAPPGAMHQFFNPDWTPVPDHDSFGHDIETGYLLIEAAETLGLKDDPRTLAVAKSLEDHALDYSWDKSRGGYFETGGTFGPIYERKKGWWTQAEGLNGLMAMARHFPDDPRHYRELFSMQWKFIQSNVIDSEQGGWYSTSLDTGGDPNAPKGSEWKAGYHDGRALMNAVDWGPPTIPGRR
jgi:mannobiose 2-epimerase